MARGSRRGRRGGEGDKPEEPAGPPEPEQFSIPAKLVEHILLGPANDQRVLQDSPVLGDVWLAYAADPAGIQDLLVTPHRDATAAEVAECVSSGLKRIGRTSERQKERAKIAYLQGIVAARLYFDEVLRALVPQTQWWVQGNVAARLRSDGPQAIRESIHRVLAPERFRAARAQGAGVDTKTASEDFSALHRYVALAGLVSWAGSLKRPAEEPKGKGPQEKEDEIEKVFSIYLPHIDEIVDRMFALFRIVEADKALAEGESKRDEQEEEEEKKPKIFQVSLNRRASPALDRSVPAVKADAARTLFNVDCKKIVWAVLDSGINSTHDAFMLPGVNGKPPASRVRKIFDFTKIREIVSSDNADLSEEEENKLLDGILAQVDLDRNEARERLQLIAKDAVAKRPTNWDVVEELITLTRPRSPVSPHGTHVAGIIGADAKESRNGSGMCPDIRFYDFRVLGKTLEDTEFAIIAALQYIRYVNERHSYITIHGANLSLSIPHNVRNYACGRTPVCVECERLVDNGVVVVAAAGNRGLQKFETNDGVFESYAAFSITDPGNGDGVLTVGATHGNWPHTYGVSFFSSRGPTGDGRLKPDLVAPGERVQSTVLGNEWGPESGTSMAAPHVSGAAAMLMARYPELVGQPRRIKRILCESATDLGRERSFQGHGMLDVLRAFQAI